MYNEDSKAPAAGGGGGAGCLNPLAQQPPKIPASGVCAWRTETHEANISFLTLGGTGFSWQTWGEGGSVPRWEETLPVQTEGGEHAERLRNPCLDAGSVVGKAGALVPGRLCVASDKLLNLSEPQLSHHPKKPVIRAWLCGCVDKNRRELLTLQTGAKPFPSPSVAGEKSDHRLCLARACRGGVLPKLSPSF